MLNLRPAITIEPREWASLPLLPSSLLPRPLLNAKVVSTEGGGGKDDCSTNRRAGCGVGPCDKKFHGTSSGRLHKVWSDFFKKNKSHGSSLNYIEDHGILFSDIYETLLWLLGQAPRIIVLAPPPFCAGKNRDHGRRGEEEEERQFLLPKAPPPPSPPYSSHKPFFPASIFSCFFKRRLCSFSCV